MDSINSAAKIKLQTGQTPVEILHILLFYN